MKLQNLAAVLVICPKHYGPESSTHSNLRKHMQIDKVHLENRISKYRNKLQILKKQEQMCFQRTLKSAEHGLDTGVVATI